MFWDWILYCRWEWIVLCACVVGVFLLIMLCLTIGNFFSVNVVIDRVIGVLQWPRVSLVGGCA